MTHLKESPSQTAGPYLHIGCTPGTAELPGMTDLGATMVTEAAQGERINLTLTVLDGAEAPVTDALLEIWQAGPDGRFGPTTGFSHWGRQATDAKTGEAVFRTLKPDAVGDQAPHILLWIAARGINLALTTRLYFPDVDNSTDAVFMLAGNRAQTLVAEKTKTGYAHTIRLQGPRETVFFDV